MTLEYISILAKIGADNAVVTGTMLITGVLTGWVGYRIRYRGDVHLIAGYKNGVPADTEALSRTVGRVVLAIAAVTVLAGLMYPVLNVGSISEVTYWLGYTIAVIVLSGYGMLTSRRHTAEP